jgi:hypothetical protein
MVVVSPRGDCSVTTERPLTDDPALQHTWKRYEDGVDIDIFAYEPYNPHNGPVCERCGEGFCHHCEPDCYHYVCPEATA